MRLFMLRPCHQRRRAAANTVRFVFTPVENGQGFS
jgi:hypothetical protein